MTLQIQFSGNINKRRKRFEEKKISSFVCGNERVPAPDLGFGSLDSDKSREICVQLWIPGVCQKPVSSPPGKNVSVTVSEGMTGAELGKVLKNRELIRDAKVFQVQMELSEYKNQIHPGTYILNSSQTADEMLAVLAGEAETESEE